jgi:hypothetical protein
MTIFCITGFSKASTELTESVLLAGGMATHLPLERDPTLNLVRWHERAIGAQQQTSSSASEVVDKSSQPSRIWLQLAIDLMVANMNSVHWGWAHTGAVPWLDFWSQLEPEIRFVLVCEDRLALVCRLLEEGQTPESMARHLALWSQNHQEMLRFHLRNPAKSLLVWAAEVQTQPKQLIASIEHHWQTRLDDSRVAPQASEQPTSLLKHIALRILSEHPHTAPLDFELQALIGSPSSNPASGDFETTDWIALYQQFKERSILQAHLLQAEQRINDSKDLFEHERAHLQSTLEQERTQWHQQLDDVQGKIKQETSAKQDALKQLATEQNTNADLKKEKDEFSAAEQKALIQNKELHEESDLLLAQLQLVQEELENYYLQNKEQQIKVKTLQSRWLRAVQSHPELLDFEDFEILSESKTELTAHWRINQLNLEGVMKGPFEFKTLIENGVAGLVFSKDAKGLSPLHRWPLVAAKDRQLIIIPFKGQEIAQKRAASIFQLATTDRQLVQLLTDKLIKVLETPALAKQLSHGSALIEGLKAQRQFWETVPALLRFDDVQLFGQQNTKLKSVIGLRLNNADLHGLKANPFEFQLQLNLAANQAISSAHFIFDDKSAANPFENWTNNVKSSAGKAVMAMQLGPKGWHPHLWHALSQVDQQWLRNTVRLLPFILNTLQNQGLKLEKGWSTWAKAAIDLVNWSKLSMSLPESTITATDDTPSQLQPPDAAPVPDKAPRKPRPAKTKPVRPTVTVKVPAKAVQKPKSARATPGKPAFKAKVTAKVATKVTDKSKLVKAKPAKPAASAKVAAKVAAKTKRRKS